MLNGLQLVRVLLQHLRHFSETRSRCLNQTVNACTLEKLPQISLRTHCGLIGGSCCSSEMAYLFPWCDQKRKICLYFCPSRVFNSGTTPWLFIKFSRGNDLCWKYSKAFPTLISSVDHSFSESTIFFIYLGWSTNEIMDAPFVQVRDEWSSDKAFESNDVKFIPSGRFLGSQLAKMFCFYSHLLKLMFEQKCVHLVFFL